MDLVNQALDLGNNIIVRMVKMSKDMKRRVSTVMWMAKTVFHWGFIPTVLYLGNALSHMAFSCLYDKRQRLGFRQEGTQFFLKSSFKDLLIHSQDGGT